MIQDVLLQLLDLLAARWCHLLRDLRCIHFARCLQEHASPPVIFGLGLLLECEGLLLALLAAGLEGHLERLGLDDQ